MEAGSARGAITTHHIFCPENNAFIMLTKKSSRRGRSVTTHRLTPQATTFRDKLVPCHRTCIISQEPLLETLFASHLIPRRLGDVAIQSAFQRFTGSATIVSRIDPLIGVSLFSGLDTWVKSYSSYIYSVHVIKFP